ncbi:MAG: hypothetical protein IH867_12095 [Chloroflexi bacterium]|nr:hypothetical protein [Chloroflexota bacterium]
MRNWRVIVELPKTAAINGCRTTGIYCRVNCPPGRRTRPENRVHFASISDARSEGFRACKVCKPDDPADGEPWKSKVIRRL